MGIVCADTIMAILSFSVYALIKSYIDEYSSAIQIVGGSIIVIVGLFIFFKNPVPQIRKNKAGSSALWQDFGSMFGFTLANFAIIIPYILAFFTMFNVELSSSTLSDKINIDTELLMDKHYDNDVVVYNDEAKASDYFDIIERNEQRDKAEAHEKAMAEVAEELKVPRMIRNILVLGGFLLGAMVWWVGLTSLINLFRRNFRPRHLIIINRIAGIIISALGAYTLLSVIIKL
jgi:threonine/homoserine/homoserine lactone efflux protein